MDNLHNYVRTYMYVHNLYSIECEKVVEKTSERILTSNLATGNNQTASDLPPASGMYVHVFIN